MTRVNLKIILFISFIFLSNLGVSQQANNFALEINESYEITAENMYIERENQIIAFSGNVELKQGIARLKTDQMKLFFKHNFDEENFYKMSASGNITIKNNDLTSIYGNLANYSVTEKKLIMTNGVTLKNQMSTIKGNKLILDLNSGKIEIFDDELDQERVKGVLVE
tara:strand:+ start:157 stop:657 length:501 start_codon:yes stop_codon:yes gene_type:complete